MYSMEENAVKGVGHLFSQLDPEIQLYTIERGLESALNSSDEPVKAILAGFKYLYNATAASKYLLLNKPSLTKKLKLMAKEKFALDYANLSVEESNSKLDELCFNYNKITPDSAEESFFF